jgi:guanyl-specific ribonuclease Sa
LAGWVRVALVLGIVAFLVYRNWQRQDPHPQSQPRAAPTRPVEAPAEPTPAAGRATTIANQTIYDQDREVVFRGHIDLGPTLARIKAGERLRFPNDGATFQNRERHLPRHPAGYYREYVHPTPGLPGPGPQRVVVGENGETYYTPDHYRTFQRVDEP